MSWHTILIFGCGYLVGVMDVIFNHREVFGGKR